MNDDRTTLEKAREALRLLLDDPRSTVSFDNGADDPYNAYYWEIDNPHLEQLARVLGVEIPKEKQR
jgi:hypothetical protein